MFGAKNASVEIHPNITYNVCVTGVFIQVALNLNIRIEIEIPYRVFPEWVVPRILSLESVDYFGTTDHNFKVYWKIRIEDRLKRT